MTAPYQAVEALIQVDLRRRQRAGRAPQPGIEVDEPELARLVEHEIEGRETSPFQVLAHGFRGQPQRGKVRFADRLYFVRIANQRRPGNRFLARIEMHGLAMDEQCAG